MIQFEAQIKERFASYSNPNAKVKAEVDAGRLFRLKKGVYSDSKDEHPFICANALIRPSYVSFLSALAYHGLIPEAVYATMSATSSTKKTKTFSNSLGRFLYFDVPSAAFPFGIMTASQGFQIATPEKAIADILYFSKPVRSVKGLKALLFEDLRIDEDLLKNLNRESLMRILPLYRSVNANLMMKLLEAWHGK